MHSLFGKRGVMLAGLLALALAALTPTAASAKPEPGARGRGFRLFARSLGALTVNRVYCGLATTGEVCVDSTNSSTIGGGYWPKGTADQYNFNSGLQLAGVIGGTKPTNPWGGDTTGAFFFDPKGTTQHGQEIQPIYNSQNPEDVANWPAAGKVPVGDATAALYDPLLQGRVNGSQGDVWWLSWEGNPTQNAGRSHPLGVLVETRGMGWNFPTGNQDIVYFVYTFYNITSTNAADYAAARPDMQPILMQAAQQFQAQNNAAFGVTLPAGGYTISSLFAAFARDDDVGNAGTNYSTVNLPFALGVTYDQDFGRPTGWTFDAAIFNAPFFAGVGFTGAKYLKSPSGPGQIQLFSNTINGGGLFNDPRDTKQLFRYLSGTVSTAAGDGACNEGNPQVTRVCFVNNSTAADMRFFQSSTALNLAPGAFGSIVVAYIYAAPVITTSITPSSTLHLKPGEPLVLDPKSAAAATILSTNGANAVDSLMGFRGWSDLNGDCATVSPTSTVGCAQQNEFRVVPGSLLGKALTAQAVFDNKFLLPFAPDSPEFFLVPGDNQVTVLWRPSKSEDPALGGDPFFTVAKNPTVIDPVSGTPVANPLYDPNYRQFDVEGYRIYRGRVDAPNALTLLVQFDYAGTTIKDFAGQVNPVLNCAPEIGVGLGTSACPFDNPFPTPGTVTQGRTKFKSIPLVVANDVPITQVALGQRSALATTPLTAIVLAADTALTGGGTNGSCAPSACPPLADTGVPFVYVDNTVRNNFRYFYSVTAFDVNSVQSGPTSLESPRLTKSVTPAALASNYDNAAVLDNSLYGRDVKLTDNAVPAIDPVTGAFSKPFPPADGWKLALGQFVKQLIAAPGGITAHLDSMQLGSVYDATPNKFYVSLTTDAGVTHSVLAVTQSQDATSTAATLSFTGINVDQGLAARFGGNNSYGIPGALTATLPGHYYDVTYARGCANPNTANGFPSGKCDYNGARWFVGPSPANNETKADPTAPGNQANASGAIPADFNNAGALTGVKTIYEHRAYATVENLFRQFEGGIGGANRAADFNVYWGAAGKVDSVIDVTHNVVVPFAADHIAATWGILNQAATTAPGSFDARPADLTVADWACVAPLRSFPAVGASGGLLRCTAAAPVLSNTVALGSIALSAGSTTASAAGTFGVKTAPARANGFSMYLPGHVFFFEMAAASPPAAGTVWTMRSYTGAIAGGHGGGGGNEGNYGFHTAVRPFTAAGAEVRFSFALTNEVVAASRADLSKVHTVPDPYYITSEFEQTTDTKIIKFVNLPNDAVIRIYSSSGVLVNLLEHHSSQFGGSEDWDVRNRNNQVVASGVYFYHIEAGDARRVGRFTIVNFAQ
jgi:hypothetical protein